MQKIKIISLLVIPFIFTLLLAAQCGTQPPTPISQSTPIPESVEITNIYEEEIIISEITQQKTFDQCDAASSFKAQVLFSQTSSQGSQEELVLKLSVSGEAGVGDLVPGVEAKIEGAIEQHFASSKTTGQGHQESAGIEVPAHTLQEYTIIWQETRREGTVEYVEDGITKTVGYSYRTGLELLNATGKDLPCTNEAPTLKPTDIPPTSTSVPDLPTATAASTATPTAGPSITFRDDFDNVLANGWNLVREASTHWSLTDIPGAWRVTLQSGGFGDLASAPANNLLMRESPSGNFEIATLVNFSPTSNYQIAGLLIYQDDRNALQFGRAFCDTPDVCVNNGIYFDNIQVGEMGENYATATSNPSIAYLRLRREGTTYTGYYSEDGTNWTVIGQHISKLNPLYVGLIAAQAYEAETTAHFEYFTIEVLP